MKYQLATTCRLGNRSTNQDRFSVVETTNAVMMIIADGMGGHGDGKLAADCVVESLLRSFNSTRFPHPEPRKFLKQIIAIAHQEVINAGASRMPPVAPRTTCVVCLVQNGMATWAHVGDSRLYWIRKGKILEKTKDHSRVEELYQKGVITAQQREKHPQRNIVTRCIGSPQKAPLPSVSKPTLLVQDDVLLLCTDGLWGALPDSQIIHSLERFDVDFAIEQLAHDAEMNSFPKSDNISAVAFCWESNESSTALHNKVIDDDLDDLTEGLDAMIRALDEIEKDMN